MVKRTKSEPPAKKAAKTTVKWPKAKSGRPSRGPVQVIGVKFPVAYHSIMQTEAEVLGVSRGQFLTMLVKRKRGELHLERGAGAPEYQVKSDAELRTMKLYVWHVHPTVRQAIDEERLQMGNIGVAAFLIHLINHWLGKPMGLRS